MPETAAINVISLLIEAAKTDTIYRDVYLRRARELLSPMLDEASYRALGSTQKEIDEVVRRTRSAVLQHDWAEAGELSAQAEQIQKRIDALASVSGLGLVGGDGRFGGVADLVSISRTDARDSVYARFAVLRRARMVARWR